MDAPIDFHAVRVPVSDGTSFIIVHNLPIDGHRSFYAELEKWMLKTSAFTAENFCFYIFEKRKRGLTDRVAMTQAQFEKHFLVKFEDVFAEGE